MHHLVPRALLGVLVLPALAAGTAGAQGPRAWQPKLRVDNLPNGGEAPLIVTVPPGSNGTAPTPTTLDTRGIVSLRIATPQGTFICSGTLLSTLRHVATAAHCITNGSNAITATSVGVQFGGNWFSPVQTVTVGTSSLAVNPAYTGAVIDGADAAVITLPSAITGWGSGFDLYDSGPLEGQNFEVHGYGGRGVLSAGSTLGAGTRGFGYNRWDFLSSNPLATRFNNAWGQFGDGDGVNAGGILWADGDNSANTATRPILGFERTEAFVDAGSAALRTVGTTDASCWINAVFCDAVGRGNDEALVAGGDSGGGSFIGGRLAGITSFGAYWTCDVNATGTAFNPPAANISRYFDCANINLPGNTFISPDQNIPTSFAPNSSFGEWSGMVSTQFNGAWIRSIIAPTTTVPEPSTYALMATGLAGLALAARRRRR